MSTYGDVADSGKSYEEHGWADPVDLPTAREIIDSQAQLIDKLRIELHQSNMYAEHLQTRLAGELSL